jgi:hypothetical protein
MTLDLKQAEINDQMIFSKIAFSRNRIRVIDSGLINC